jgi:hypothetical protein
MVFWHFDYDVKRGIVMENVAAETTTRTQGQDPNRRPG